MFTALILSALSPAQAYVFWGNPTLNLTIERTEGDLIGGSVKLAGVRVHACDGSSVDYSAGGSNIDPVAGWSTTITGGDLCDVEVFWDNDGLVWSKNFGLKASLASTDVELVGAVSSERWTPFSVVSGSFSGSDPFVQIDIN